MPGQRYVREGGDAYDDHDAILGYFEGVAWYQKKGECQNAPLYRAQDDVDVEFLRNMAQKKKSLR